MDNFVLNAAGGTVTIDNFKATDHLDLTQILAGLQLTPTEAGLSPYISVTAKTEGGFCGMQDTDTLITITGTAGTVHVNLEDYNAGGLAGLLSQNTLVLPT